MSDCEFIGSSCDEANEDWTSYPSDSVVDEWKPGKEKRNECRESLKQGNCFKKKNCLPQLVNLYFFKFFNFSSFAVLSTSCRIPFMISFIRGHDSFFPSFH